MSSTATALNACLSFSAAVSTRKLTHLEHLDVRDAEVEIRRVAQDQATAEQQRDWENGFEEHVFIHVDVFRAVEEISRPL
jgi:hypothetical protein